MLNVFYPFVEKGVELFNASRMFVLVLGGFGLIGLAVLAIFGKIKWYWLGALFFGLLVISQAGSIISWITGYSPGISDLPRRF